MKSGLSRSPIRYSNSDAATTVHSGKWYQIIILILIISIDNIVGGALSSYGSYEFPGGSTAAATSAAEGYGSRLQF